MTDQGVDYTYQAPTQCYVGDNTSDFKNCDMNAMKSMIANANPEAVHRAATGWQGVHDQLVDAKAAYEHAVAEVMEHWEGPSADQFQARAKVISKKIHDTSTYASHVSTAMTSAANKLSEIQPLVMAMEKPDDMDSAGDWLTDGNRDEGGLNRDLANKNVSAQQIADGREGDMSAGRQAQMAMAVKMEELGAVYNGQTKSMGSWKRSSGKDRDEDYPGEPGGIAPVPIVAGSVGGPAGSAGTGNLSRSTGSASSVKGVKSPTTNGISGGVGTQKPTAGSQIGAGNLSFKGGPGVGTGGIGTGAGAGTGGVGGGMVGSGAGAGAGGAGGAGIGGGIGAGAGLGAGAAGRGGAGAMGRGGIGAGAGSGAAGNGAAKGLKGNSLARTKGGEIGKSVVKPGAGQQGGSALRQKPKTATGGAGNSGRNGIAGHGAQTGNGKDKKRRDNSRPDYLVEDEQTWANDRTVNPKVVE
ncbi:MULTISPECIES: WXG100 family type VII secretion target [unclassified Streptomyces]|uniref:WXG100 family type VII secretion target n=1 Tax=unclassified Streptomyces TaxID=2593676 RepID=UPI00278C3E83|nr:MULTISPECIES: PPE domain-containing protein [unclassified Streptomyces]